MAEALALFASVLTIATLIKEIVKRAKTICRASEEFRILQEQVEDFGILVRKMTDQQAKIDDQATETALHRATQTLGQLDNIIKNDLLREHNSTIRVGRRAWARNRSMVLRLQDTLKENRLSLLAAMSANNMSSSKKSSAIASNQDRRLVGIQHIVSTTHQAILSQSTAIDSILQILSGGRSDPAGPLERSPSFFPEAYTNVNRLPMSGLIVIHSYQKEMFKDCMTNSYDIFLIKSSRRWYRISTTVHIYRSSVYWTATQLSSQERIYADAHGKMAGSAVLPYSLQSRIQLLLTAEELDRVARFNLSLSDGREIQISRSECHLPSAKTLTELSNSVVAAWGFIDDLGCARYSENEVIRVQVLRAPFQFLSCLNGRAVVEHVFDSPGPNGQMIYNIRVLHCMKGNDFFAQLAGVVVDHKSMRMKSVLIEYSQATRSLEQMAQLQGVPWAKRERWARQLVEGVSQLHHNGFVAGTLYCCESPVVIDATEKLQFRCLKSKFNMGRTRGDWYPPEFRYLQTRSTDTREADCPDVTSKADIFKLGAVLWLLAENPSRMSNSPSCIRAQCAGQSRICNQQSHFSTIDLPPLPDDVPLYYREMIGACRAREPNDRPAARVLLKMFPSSYSAPILEHVLHPNTGFDSMPENLVVIETQYCYLFYPRINSQPTLSSQRISKPTSSSPTSVHKKATSDLLTISNNDADAYQRLTDPTPLDHNREERLRLATAYVYKLHSRLNKAHITRFLHVVDKDAKSNGRTLDELKKKLKEVRDKVAEIFEQANEYELWEEFLEGFMRYWLHREEGREQRGLRFEKWRGTRRGGVS